MNDSQTPISDLNPNNNQPAALVIGGSSGIGLATARLLVAAGYNVAIAGRSEERLQEAASVLAGDLASDASGQSIVQLSADLADADQGAWCVAQTAVEFGRIDVLVNCAAIAPLVPIADTDAELLQRTLAVNTIGPGAACLAAWPLMVAQQRGVIVNVSSMATVDPFPGFFAYATSKGGLNAMVKSLAVEGKPHNIRAYAIAPGAVETPMLRAIVPVEALPNDKTLSPVEVARVIMACVSGTHPAASGDLVQVPSP